MDYTYWVTRVLTIVLLYTDLLLVTSSTLFFWSALTGPASTHWLMALMMMWRLDLELGFTNNLGPKQKTNMKIYHMDIVLRVLSITVNQHCWICQCCFCRWLLEHSSPASNCGNAFYHCRLENNMASRLSYSTKRGFV